MSINPVSVRKFFFGSDPQSAAKRQENAALITGILAVTLTELRGSKLGDAKALKTALYATSLGLTANRLLAEQCVFSWFSSFPVSQPQHAQSQEGYMNDLFPCPRK